MARISVNIPNEKLPSFLQANMNLGIDTQSVLTKKHRETIKQKKKFPASLKNIFGWEYYSNELEYE